MTANLPQMSNNLWGKLVGDRGYLSQPLFEQLFERGLQLITPLRKNMKNRLEVLDDKLLTRKRSVIETIIDQLKTDLAHPPPQHDQLCCNLIAGLIAYTWQAKKPSLQSDKDFFLASTNLTPNSG